MKPTYRYNWSASQWELAIDVCLGETKKFHLNNIVFIRPENAVLKMSNAGDEIDWIPNTSWVWFH